MGLQLDSVVARSEGQVGAEVDGVVVLLSVEMGSYFNLTPMGGHIWRLLEQPQPVGAICDALRERFEVDQPTCEREVLAFLEKLLARQLVVAY